MYRGTLTITLESDLCVSDGDGFSSGIDIDIAHDKQGYPIIPGRRIKGCLCEAVHLLGENQATINNLFGEANKQNGGSLRILGNGASLIKSQRIGTNQDAQAVLENYCYVRANTALTEGGSADENTLRFTRVVGQYIQCGQECEKLQFEAKLILDTCDEEQKELLENACKSLRNIGYNRNRGLGAVSCQVSINKTDISNGKDALGQRFNIGQATRIEYQIKLDSPLMLPQQKGTESLDYIPGTSVLGFFANRLRNAPNFDELFLQGKLRFSPLYPVAKNGRCIPAPAFIAKMKGGAFDGKCFDAWTAHEIKNNSTDNSDAGVKDKGRAAQATAKPLKSGFVNSTTFQPYKVKTEIIYHHSRKNNKLYTQHCVQEGQIFAGFIEVVSDADRQLLETVATVLQNSHEGEISFGRSKTAQYASCSLEGDITQASKLLPIKVCQGKRYAFVLDSDALLVENGVFTTDYPALKRAIQDALGDKKIIFNTTDIEKEDSKGDTEDGKADREKPNSPSGTSLRYRTVAGFNAKWGLKKPHIRAFAAGSTLVFTPTEDMSDVPVELFIGERQAEGFGRVLLFEVREILPDSLGATQENVANHTTPAGVDDWRMTAIEYARENEKQGIPLGNAFLGRLMRMAKESENQNDLDMRLKSIKNETKRDAAQKLVKGLNEKSKLSEWKGIQEAIVIMLTVLKYRSKQKQSAARENQDSQSEQGFRAGERGDSDV